MKKIALILFVAVSLGELLAQLTGYTWLHHICKPLILVFLGLFYFISVSPAYRSWMVMGAILFSFLGDSFLMYEDIHELYFMLGLGSFLVAHIFYLIAYRQHTTPLIQDPTKKVQRIRMAFPVILAGTGLIVVLYPALGELKIPVMLYAAVLMIMVITALFRLEETDARSFWMVFVGAVLFMLSDSLLAINKFLHPVAAAGIWIMISYIAAQYLIINGLIRHTKGLEA